MNKKELEDRIKKLRVKYHAAGDIATEEKLEAELIALEYQLDDMEEKP